MSTSTPAPSRRFRLLHTADWHLGKTLGDLDRSAEHALFLQWLEERLLEEEVDLLVIAGDLFDSATPPQSAVRLYFDFLATLYRRGGPRVAIIAGNHDSPGHLESPRDLLRVIRADVVGQLPLLPGRETDWNALLFPYPDAENPALLLAAIPYLRERELRTGQPGQSAAEIAAELRAGLAKIYADTAHAARPWRERGLPIVATGHLTALGASTSHSERDIHIGGLGAMAADAFPPEFAYVALGHLHRPQAIGGREHLRYAGSPVALGFSEAAHPREVRLLEFEAGQLVAQRPLPVPLARPLLSLRTTRERLAVELATLTPPQAPLPAWVEITVTGTGGGESLFEEVRRAAQGRPFEVVRVQTEPVGGPLSLEAEEQTQADDLLASPRAVFSRRLEAEKLPESERDALLLAFEELMARYEETLREL